jgi:23S rRNA pseudouridine1911/1915/1917 synthase
MVATYPVEHPATLLAFLAARHPLAKKTTIRQWVKQASVHVNGRAVTRARHPLQAGDVVAIHPTGDVLATGPLPRGLKLVYEDTSLIVIDKPENLLSMASDSQREKTAYAFLMHYVRRGQRRGAERIWIVHRLDRETSGLMVFARTEGAKRELQAQWPQVEKRYLAIVEGAPPADSGVLRCHLDESNPWKVHIAPPGQRTRHAVTRYRVIQQRASLTLIEVTTETGRRHQIRVQLADAGCPIIGDEKYGARSNPARRLGLHASLLRFPHPVSGECLTFESALPRPLARVLR